MPTATGIDQKRTTFQASTISATHVPISQKYVARGEGRFTAAPHDGEWAGNVRVLIRHGPGRRVSPGTSRPGSTRVSGAPSSAGEQLDECVVERG